MIGVVRSGSLDDGPRGLASIHEAGGVTMVLTPDTLTGAGMPENAIAYGVPIDVVGHCRKSPQLLLKPLVAGDQRPGGNNATL